jgi:hypothetical protein
MSAKLIADAGEWTVYQPLIVGLGAVVLATIGNTLLEWFKQVLLDRATAKSLRKALLEELRFARDTAEINVKRCSEVEENGSFIIPIQERFQIYDQNIANIGKLKSDEISAVVKAYAMLHSKVETLSIMGTLHRIENCVVHAVVDAKWATVLKKQSEGVESDLSAAIEILERGT